MKKLGENRGSQGHRRERVGKEIRQVIANFLLRGFRGELKGLVTVARVGVAADLKSARVFISVMGTEAEKTESLASIESHTRDFQFEVGKHLRLKSTPKITFALDTGLEKSLRVDQILRNISEERKKAESSEPEEAE